ncbi:MAG: hypothetical protein IKK83_05175 [Clostridia bacterium]|nr:hypothetical protein [Clostridia bacterium]
METNNNVMENEIEVTAVQNKRWVTVGYIAVAFICAIALWFYVADYDRIIEKEITNVPVALLVPSEETGLSVESGMDNFITVKVTGKKALINEMTADDLYAYVDASGIKDEIDVQLDVQVDVLVEGVSVSDARDIPSISVSLVKNTIKDFVVTPEIVGGSWDAAFDLVTQCLTPSIKITGSASQINNIDVAVVRLDVGEINGPKLTYGTIELLDSDGNTIPQTYLTLSEKNIEVYINVFTEKELVLDVAFSGGIYDIDTAGAEVKCSPASVTVYGPLKKLEALEALTIYVDEKKIDGATYSETISLPALSEEMVYKNGDTDVAVTIKQNDIMSKSVAVRLDNINIVNVPEGMRVDISGMSVNGGEYGDEAKIVIRGYRESVQTINALMLDISVDYTDYFGDTEMEFNDVEAKIGYVDVHGVFTTDVIRISGYVNFEEGDNSSDESRR